MSEQVEQQPVAETQQPVAEGRDFAAELELVKSKNQQLISEKQAAKKQLEDMQRQMADFQRDQQKAKQSQLQEQGEYQTLWKEATGTVSKLQEELSAKDSEIERLGVQYQEQCVKSIAFNAFSEKDVRSHDAMFTLLKDRLRWKDGSVVALAGGVETPLEQHLEALKAPGSGMDFMFSGSGARGMGATGSSTTTAGGKSWSSMSLQERLQMQLDKPQQAAQLEAAG